MFIHCVSNDLCEDSFFCVQIFFFIEIVPVAFAEVVVEFIDIKVFLASDCDGFGGESVFGCSFEEDDGMVACTIFHDL